MSTKISPEEWKEIDRISSERKYGLREYKSEDFLLAMLEKVRPKSKQRGNVKCVNGKVLIDTFIFNGVTPYKISCSVCGGLGRVRTKVKASK